MEHYDMLYANQYGFRRKRSTVDALIKFMNDITKSIDNKEISLAVYLDLSKAFDTINYDIVFDKLEHYGIRGNALKWFKSYLSERKQFVEYNGHKSTISNVLCGVPQGSILGPLLFIIYTNDIPNNLN